MNFSQCVDVSAQKRFRSVNKYGRTAAIFKIANSPFLNIVTISLSHLPRDHWSDIFEICLTCSIYGLDVSARKWFRSIDKYGRRQPFLIFTVIPYPPKPLEEFCQNFAFELLSISRCVCPKMILVCQQIRPKGNHL